MPLQANLYFYEAKVTQWYRSITPGFVSRRVSHLIDFVRLSPGEVKLSRPVEPLEK